MGCGGSTPTTNSKGGKREGGKKGNEEPELNGKVKFLSCPSVCEVTHHETKHRYFFIAFAPQTHHGLIIAARNSTTGTILSKEVTDAELVKEKEAQGITLSWNLFFKAVSTEIAKANKSGAKYEVTPTGTVKLEIKISIAGTQTNKKVDSYSAELQKLDNTDANLYRLFMEPIATFYGKKRTDLLDRPDPVREKQYGECEANAIIKSASIARCKKTIDETLPQLSPLRDTYRALSQEAYEKRCKLNVMRAMVKEKTTEPMILKPLNMKIIGVQKEPQDDDTARIKFTSHLEPNLFSGMVKTVLRHKSPEDALLTPIEELILTSVEPLQLGQFKSDAPVTPDMPTGTGDVMWDQLLKFDGNDFDAFDAATLHAESGGHSLYLVTLLMLKRYGVLGSEPPAMKTFVPTQEDPYTDFKFPAIEQVKNYCYVIEAIYNAQKKEQPAAGSGGFHTTVKAAMSMRALHYMLYPGGMWTRLRLTPPEMFLAIIACLVHDADHPGVNNAYLNTSRTFLSCLYGVRSPLERHHVAVALEVASIKTCALEIHDVMRAELCQIVVGTDLGQHSECLSKFSRRASAISDWSRMHDDRIMCLAMLVKLSDSFYCYSPKVWYQPFAEMVREEFYSQGDMHKANPATTSVPLQDSMDRRKGDTDSWLKGHGTFGYYVVLPVLNTLSEISPAMAELHRNCSENCS